MHFLTRKGNIEVLSTIMNKIKEWALVQNVALAIKIKVLNTTKISTVKVTGIRYVLFPTVVLLHFLKSFTAI